MESRQGQRAGAEQRLGRGDRGHECGDEVDRLLLRLAGRDFRPGGPIRITAPDNLAYSYLPDYLGAFTAVYPDIDLELVVSNEDFDLSRREADLAVRATSSPPEHLIGRKVFALPWAFYAAASYLERRGRPAGQDRLQGHTLIGAEGALSRLPACRWVARRASDISVRCSNLMAMAAMARAGRGIALLPDDQVQPELDRLFPVAPTITSEIWLLTHPELRRTERIRLLMSHLLEHFRADPRLAELAVL